MQTIDLSPLYRSTVGFDRLASLLEGAFRGENTSAGYPPYNIEVVDENHYAITLAVAGIKENELDIEVERGVLTVRGRKDRDDQPRQFLYRGIASRGFERKFNLADHVEVTRAKLEDGLLTIHLVREIPEAMKPRRIVINDANVLNHKRDEEQVA